MLTRAISTIVMVLPSISLAQIDRPNFLIIVADDVGFAELGPYGSEIDTPALDALAEEGIRFTNFYAQMNCSPTRAMLMSGTDNHLAGLGTMGAGLQSPNQEGVPGYEGVLSDRVVTFARLLQDNGYRTYTTGKWHLGHTPDKLPVARGFDQSLIQTGGGPADSHFNLNGREPEEREAYFENDVDVTGMPVFDDFFSNDFYTEKMLEYLRTDPAQDKPFLAYLNFSAPHIPVQAPETHIDLYRGRYDDGYDILRETRLANMVDMGLFPAATVPGERAPTTASITWGAKARRCSTDRAGDRRAAYRSICSSAMQPRAASAYRQLSAAGHCRRRGHQSQCRDGQRYCTYRAGTCGGGVSGRLLRRAGSPAADRQEPYAIIA